MRPFGAAPHFIVIPSLGIAYGRVPKVANSTIKRTLALGADLRDRFPENGFSKDNNWRGLAPDARFVNAATVRRDHTDLVTFAFVREPLSRLASCFRSKISEPRTFGRGMRREGLSRETTFPEFVSHVARRPDWRCNVHYRPQAAILSHRGTVVPEFIGRFESLQSDWARLRDLVMQRTGRTLPDLPQRAAKRPLASPERYFGGDQALIGLARARYARDYELFYPDLIT